MIDYLTGAPADFKAYLYVEFANGSRCWESQEEAPRCKELKKYAFAMTLGGTFCLDNTSNKVPVTP